MGMGLEEWFPDGDHWDIGIFFLINVNGISIIYVLEFMGFIELNAKRWIIILTSSFFIEEKNKKMISK